MYIYLNTYHNCWRVTKLFNLSVRNLIGINATDAVMNLNPTQCGKTLVSNIKYSINFTFSVSSASNKFAHYK